MRRSGPRPAKGTPKTKNLNSPMVMEKWAVFYGISKELAKRNGVNHCTQQQVLYYMLDHFHFDCAAKRKPAGSVQGKFDGSDGKARYA